MIEDDFEWRHGLVSYAIMFPFRDFQKVAMEIIPERLKDHVGPRLLAIYTEIQTELAQSLTPGERHP